MYRHRTDVIAFKQFALQEIESMPSQKLPEQRNIERNIYIVESINFERKLLVKQMQLLDGLMTEANAFFYSMSEYLDNLRRQLKKDFLERRINPMHL